MSATSLPSCGLRNFPSSTAERLFSLVLASLLAACGGSEDQVVGVCTPGESAPCACTDGQSGAQLCLPDGTFAVCVCSTADAGQDAAAGQDADADAGNEASSSCPADMVMIVDLGVCIDRFEASKGAGGAAESKPERLPWVNLSGVQAGAACKAAGKRLCDGAEWKAACAGPAPGTAYPYGSTFDPLACNGMEYASSHQGPFAAPTGSIAACVGGFPSLFDMSGNANEMTSECSSGPCQVRGGHWIDGADGLRCDSVLDLSAGSTGFNVGFRCCLTP